MVHYLHTSKFMMRKKQTKQTAMDIFLKRVIPPEEEPHAGPSGDVPEEGIAVIGDSSSLCVTAPKDVPGGGMWRWGTGMLMIWTLCSTRLMCVCVSKVLTTKNGLKVKNVKSRKITE